jgi:hypothetical protein
MMHISTGEQIHMKYLKIDNNKAFYINPKKVEEEWIEIDKIDKDILYDLMQIAINQNFEMDVYNEDLIANKTHQIIYKNLYAKFNGLIENESRFADESKALYAEAITKYKHEIKGT